MNLSDLAVHWLCGAMFGIGVVAGVYGMMALKQATKTLNEASAFYTKVTDEARARAGLTGSVEK